MPQCPIAGNATDLRHKDSKIYRILNDRFDFKYNFTRATAMLSEADIVLVSPLVCLCACVHAKLKSK